MTNVARRKQTPISFRSDRAAARLKLLTSNGRSQAEVMEEALDKMPVPEAEADQRMSRIRALIESIPKRDWPTMAELDAEEYDEEGNCR